MTSEPGRERRYGRLLALSCQDPSWNLLLCKGRMGTSPGTSQHEPQSRVNSTQMVPTCSPQISQLRQTP